MRLLVTVAVTLTFVLSSNLFADNLAALEQGQHVRIVMVGQGPLCEGMIQSLSGDNVTLTITKGSLECGSKRDVVSIAKDHIYQLSVTRRLTKGRVALKVLAGMGAVAALAALPLTSSDREDWLILGNVALPGLVGFGASLLVPNARQYVLLLTCPDRFHCFSRPNATPKQNPAIPNEK